MAQAFFGGVHPNDMKAATNEKAIEQLQAPAQVVIPMSMHFGAPCTPTVSKGDYVKLGQKIGEFKGLGAWTSSLKSSLKSLSMTTDMTLPPME